MNPSERLLTLFTDPVVATAIIAGIVALCVEFVRRGPGKKKKPDTTPPIPTGQPIPTSNEVDHALGRIQDLKDLLKDEREENERKDMLIEQLREMVQRYLTERNAAWDRLRNAHNEAPPYRYKRPAPQVLPDEEELHQTHPISEIDELRKSAESN